MTNSGAAQNILQNPQKRRPVISYNHFYRPSSQPRIRNPNPIVNKPLPCMEEIVHHDVHVPHDLPPPETLKGLGIPI